MRRAALLLAALLLPTFAAGQEWRGPAALEVQVEDAKGRNLAGAEILLIYLSPVVFPMPEAGLAAAVFQANPLTPLLLTTRDWLTGFEPQYLGYFLVVNAGATLLLLLVWVAYRLAMPILIERMSA